MNKKFNYLYIFLLRKLARNRNISGLLFLAITLACGIGLKDLKSVYSTIDLIDDGFSSYHTTVKLREEFNDKNILYLQLRSSGSEFSKRDICFIQNWMFESVDFSADFKILWSPFHLRHATYLQSSPNGKEVISFPNQMQMNCNEDSDFKYSEWTKTVTLPNKGFYFGMDGQSILMIIKVVAGDPLLQFEQLSNDLEKQIAKEKLGIKESWMGEVVYDYYVKKGNDSTIWVNLVSVLILLIGLRLLFKNYKIFVLLMISLGITLIIVHGIMGWLGHKMEILTLGIFLMLLISIVEDFYYLIFHFQYTRRPFAQLAWPSLLTSWTTFLGFITLTLSEIHAIQRFGFYMSFGCLLEWFILFFGLPLLFQFFPSMKPGRNSNIGRIENSRAIKSFQNGHVKFKYFLVCLLVIPAGFAVVDKLTLNATPSGFYSQSHPINQSKKEFLNYLGFDMDFSVIFKNDLPQGRMNQVSDFVRSLENVSRIESIDEYSENFLKEVPEIYKGSLKNDIEIGEYRNKFINSTGEKRIIVQLNKSDLKLILKLYQSISEFCQADCRAGGALISYSELGMGIINSLEKSVYLSCLLVFTTIFILCLANQFRLFQSFIIASLGLFGPAATLFLLYVFNQEMNLATSICFAGLIGIAGDNVIQFLNGKNTLQNMKIKFSSSFFLTGSLALLCLTFLFSDFKAIQELGIWMVVGFVLGFVGDYYLLKSYLIRLQSKNQI